MIDTKLNSIKNIHKNPSQTNRNNIRNQWALNDFNSQDKTVTNVTLRHSMLFVFLTKKKDGRHPSGLELVLVCLDPNAAGETSACIS